MAEKMVKLGRYELEGETLGRGGFGTVYKAKDSFLDRTVALKVLHPQYMVEQGFVERFRNEARLVAALEHPNIITIYDMGEADGYAFIAMRYMPGKSLRERLTSGGPLPYAQALEVIKQVCAGLGAAHARGLVHRDIKPENILFGEGQQVVITDFGLARAVQSSSSSSSTGGVGTPHYRAPELWRGKPPASPATDVYSTACMFVEMLTGERLFGGDTPDEIITRHLIDGPALPSSWPAGVPARLNAVLEKALRKNPDERYQAAPDFSDALGQLAVQPEPARAVTRVAAPVPEKAAAQIPPVRGNGQPSFLQPYWPVLVVTGLVLLCFAAGGYMVLRGLLSLSAAPAVTEAPAVPTAVPVIATQTSVPTEALTATLLVPTFTALPTAVPIATPYPVEITEQGAKMRLVPAGTFTMGSDKYADEKPPHPVSVDAFYMDVYEVTNGLYQACVSAGGCSAPRGGVSYTHSSYYGNPEFEQYPVIYVDWEQAQSYCAWRSARLPSEAEWEYAARGSDGRIYPWGNTIDSSYANYYSGTSGDKDDTSPVGTYEKGKSPFGMYDMAGNVWEWTADWYQAYPGNTVADSAYGQKYRVLRGGCWISLDSDVRSAGRIRGDPTGADDGTGFRCARSR